MTTKIELYNGATLVATKTSAPFTSIDWTPVTTGAATLTAKRYEDGVLVATSSVKNYTVQAAAGDTTAPTYIATYPKSASITSTGFNVQTQLNEIGKTYMVVVPDAATAPTSAQVKAGLNSAGAAALKAGNVIVAAASTTYSIAATALTASTAYDVYVVSEDDEATPNLQATPIKIDVSTAAAAAPLILDTYSGAKAAYSISRKLDKDYAGACVKVYKHSNTSYLDIGFVDGVLDTAALLAFSAGGNLAVKTVYDQTGNGHDWQDDYIVAGFPTLAPQIVVSGALITLNGKPVITMSGGGTNLSTLFTTAAPLSTDFSVFGNTNTYAGVGFGASDAEGYYGLMQSSGTGVTNNNVGTPSTYINGALFTGNGGALFTACNPGLVIGSFTNLDLTKFTKLNADHSIASIKAISHFAEKIVYASEQSANRAAIEANMNAFYTAY